jgi:hypothetical protein
MVFSESNKVRTGTGLLLRHNDGIKPPREACVDLTMASERESLSNRKMGKQAGVHQTAFLLWETFFLSSYDLVTKRC